MSIEYHCDNRARIPFFPPGKVPTDSDIADIWDTYNPSTNYNGRRIPSWVPDPAIIKKIREDEERQKRDSGIPAQLPEFPPEDSYHEPPQEKEPERGVMIMQL